MLSELSIDACYLDQFTPSGLEMYKLGPITANKWIGEAGPSALTLLSRR